MSLLDIRDIVPLPGGDNSSDTIIANVHLNKTILDSWNYTLYSNGSLSNGSWCLLAFEPWQPSSVLENGTWVNVTWCWVPVHPIETRGGIGIGVAVLFALGLVLNVVALAKHGKLYLPAEKRFYPIGRRWQWYWGSWVCATAMISLLTGIDIDRYFLPEIPIIISCFFWYLMQIGTMALVWEAVRHWGSWMERQYVDPDPFALREDDRRAKVELYIPLVAYFWMWLGFFLIIPRNWGAIQHQRYPQETIDVAMPAATDGRFKAAPFCFFIMWLITVFSLWHSVRHYRERNRGIINRTVGLIKFTPYRFILLIPLALVVPAFMELVAWRFEWSPLNEKGFIVPIFVGGYLPSLLIIFIQCAFGYFNPNEDKELLRQRRIRNRGIDADMGIVKRPNWWRRLNSEGLPGESMRDIIARNVREVGGGKPTTRNLEEAIPTRQDNGQNPAQDVQVEMDAIPQPSPQARELLGPVSPGDFAGARDRAGRYVGKSETRRQEHTMQTVSGLLFPGQSADAASAAARRRAELMMDGPLPTSPPPPYVERGRQQSLGVNDRPPSAGRSISTDTTNTLVSQPQQIRSMLDV